MKTKTQIWTIPNILSFFRIALIPAIVISYIKQLVILCVTLIIVSGVTDLLDGFIARRFQMVTVLGKALDPVADKLTIGSILFMIATKKPALILLLSIFALKEIIMGIEGLIIIKITGTTYSAKWYGKVTTLLLYLSSLLIIIWENMPQALVHITLALCFGFVVFSLVMYSIRNFKVLKQLKTNKD